MAGARAVRIAAEGVAIREAARRWIGIGYRTKRAAQRVGARRPLVVGDRLDTDIEGARRAGMDSLLVLTGVSTAADLDAAPPDRRPTYVARDLSALLQELA